MVGIKNSIVAVILSLIVTSNTFCQEEEKREDIEKIKYFVSVVDTCRKEKYMPISKSGIALCNKRTDWGSDSLNNWINDRKGEFNGLIANFYWSKGNWDSTFFYYYESLALFKKTGNQLLTAIAYNNLGHVLKEQGNIVKSLEVYYAALKNYETLNEPLFTAICLNNIASVHRLQKNYVEAIDYYNRSYDLGEKNKLYRTMTVSSKNIGSIYRKQEKYTQSRSYFFRAMNAAKKQNDKMILGAANKSLAQYYIDVDSTQLALKHFQISLDHFMDSQHNLSIINTQIQIGKSYVKLNKLSEAQLLLKQINKQAKEFGFKESIMNSEKILSSLYAKKKDYSKAYEHFVNYEELKSSIISDKTKKESYKKALKHEYEIKQLADSLVSKEKDIQIQRQQAQIAQEKTLRNATLIIIFFALIILWLMFKRYRTNQQVEKRELKLEIDYQNKKVMDSAVYISHRNRFLNDMEEKITEIKGSKDKLSKLDQLLSLLALKIEEEKNRGELYVYEKENQQFYKNIKEKYPDLTEKEIQLVTLLHMKLSSKEIAELTNISTKSVEVSRYRLRKKLKLDGKENLSEFIAKL